MLRLIRISLALAAILIVSGTVLTARLQSARFEEGGLSFDYPQGWKLSNSSTEQFQHLMLTREGNSAAIIVIAYRRPVCTSEQLAAARKEFTEPLVKAALKKLEANNARVAREEMKLMVGQEEAEGIRLSTLRGDEPLTQDLYSLASGHRLVNLVYIRTDKDSAQSDPAWESIRRSLKAAFPSFDSSDSSEIVKGMVLNGRAVSLPQPAYPLIAKSDRVTGVVTVQITLDENGGVIKADAIDGPSLLRNAAVKAALRAKFTPTTLNCRPVKVTGTITYNFSLNN